MLLTLLLPARLSVTSFRSFIMLVELSPKKRTVYSRFMLASMLKQKIVREPTFPKVHVSSHLFVHLALLSISSTLRQSTNYLEYSCFQSLGIYQVKITLQITVCCSRVYKQYLPRFGGT